MIGEIVARFLLGGAAVSAFAVIGDMIDPKTLAGLFGAAPSTALASLALAFALQGDEVAAVEGRSMVLGAIGMLVYSRVCVAAATRRKLPIGIAAGVSWVAWMAVAFSLWGAGKAVGALP